MKNPEFLTVGEVADILYVSKMTVYRMIENGDLPAAVINNRSYRVKRGDLDSYIESVMTDKG